MAPLDPTPEIVGKLRLTKSSCSLERKDNVALTSNHATKSDKKALQIDPLVKEDVPTQLL